MTHGPVPAALAQLREWEPRLTAEEREEFQYIWGAYPDASEEWPTFSEFVQRIGERKFTSAYETTLQIPCLGRIVYLPGSSLWRNLPRGNGPPAFGDLAWSMQRQQAANWARDYEFLCPFLDEPFPTFLHDFIAPLPKGGHSIAESVPEWNKRAWQALEEILQRLDGLPEDEHWKVMAGWNLAFDSTWTIEQRVGEKLDKRSAYRFQWMLKPGELTKAELLLLEYILCISLGVRVRQQERSRRDVLVERYVARMDAGDSFAFQDGIVRPSTELMLRVRRRFADEILAKKREILEGGFAMEGRVADLLRVCGYACEVTPRRRDGGLDIMASKHNVRLGIQVKNHKATTGSAVIQQCRGSAMEHGVMPVVVAARGFTKAAQESAKRGLPVRLATLEEVVEASMDGTDPFFQGAQRRA